MITVVGGIDSRRRGFLGGQVRGLGGTDVGAVVFDRRLGDGAGGGTHQRHDPVGRRPGGRCRRAARQAATVVSGGQLSVLSGGTASGTRRESGGREAVFAGGVAAGTQVEHRSARRSCRPAAGARHGDLERRQRAGVVGRPGERRHGAVERRPQTVLKGGTASATTISSGGQELVSSGGVDRQAVISTAARRSSPTAARRSARRC